MNERATSSAGETPASLLGDVLLGFTRLVKGELALARAEAERGLRDAAKAAGVLAMAAILLITALNVLSGAVVAGLVRLGLAPHWAAVITGFGLIAVAAALIYYAKHLLTVANLAPNRSVQNLRRDAETLKSMVAPGATPNQSS